jgi:hypothetical protein
MGDLLILQTLNQVHFKLRQVSLDLV